MREIKLNANSRSIQSAASTKVKCGFSVLGEVLFQWLQHRVTSCRWISAATLINALALCNPFPSLGGDSAECHYPLLCERSANLLWLAETSSAEE